MKTRSNPRKRPNEGEERKLVLRMVHYVNPALNDTLFRFDRVGSIGREGSAIALSDDGAASRQHALLGADGSLSDNGSKNGTFVNGMRIDKAVLAEHDCVRVGDTLFVVERLGDSAPFAHVVGRSPCLVEAVEQAHALATSKLHVLLLGETGVGKEVFAKEVHNVSRRAGALVTLNCAAIPDELFESEVFGHIKGSFTGATANKEGAVVEAAGGTLFLDEIGELPPRAQSKLLRLLEAGEFSQVGSAKAMASDARIIAATNAPIDRESSSFRRDLFARLAPGVVRIPPLRDRRGDVLLLLQHFARHEKASLSLTSDDIEKLLIYRWPMNVRQVRTLAQIIALQGKPSTAIVQMMSSEPTRDEVVMPAAMLAKSKRETVSKEEFVSAISLHNGNVQKIADHFSTSRRQVYRWVEIHRVDLSSARRPLPEE